MKTKSEVLNLPRTVIYNNGIRTWIGKSDGYASHGYLRVFPASHIQIESETIYPYETIIIDSEPDFVRDIFKNPEYSEETDYIFVPLTSVYQF